MFDKAQPDADEVKRPPDALVGAVVKATIDDGWEQVGEERKGSKSLHFKKGNVSRSILVQADEGSVTLTDDVLIERGAEPQPRGRNP